MLPTVDAATLGALLDDVAAGRLTPADAATRLARLPWADLGHTRVDHHYVLVIQSFFNLFEQLRPQAFFAAITRVDPLNGAR